MPGQAVLSAGLQALLEAKAAAEPHDCPGCGKPTTSERCAPCRRSARHGTVRRVTGPCRCGKGCGLQARSLSGLSKACYKRLFSRDRKRSMMIRRLTGVKLPATSIAAALRKLKPGDLEQVAALQAALGIFEGVAEGTLQVRRSAKRPLPGLRGARGHFGATTAAVTA